MSDDVALGSPSRVECRKCGMERGRPCRYGESPPSWDYCEERVADLRKLLGMESK